MTGGGNKPSPRHPGGAQHWCGCPSQPLEAADTLPLYPSFLCPHPHRTCPAFSPPRRPSSPTRPSGSRPRGTVPPSPSTSSCWWRSSAPTAPTSPPPREVSLFAPKPALLRGVPWSLVNGRGSWPAKDTESRGPPLFARTVFMPLVNCRYCGADLDHAVRLPRLSPYPTPRSDLLLLT